MTDEEMAEEYRKSLKQRLIDEDNFERLEMFDENVEESFLAGLKAGRPQWHDINNTEPSKEQLGKQLLIRMKSIIGDTDYDYFVYKHNGENITDVAGVIAWCEIPTFDKESE